MIYKTPLLLFFSVSLGLSYYPSQVQAQLIPDRTLGTENSIVTPQGLQYLIEGGAIRDSNLFHSFLEFNINEGQNVYFANPAGILNILTRVTGANPSDIFGNLGVDGAANLILINPNGINFGANASLDISGSFFATTADSVVFDNFTFSAINPTAPPLIAINIPLGLQYGANAGNIDVQGASLSVEENLALLGGNVSVNGATLEAPGGRVDLGGLSTTGTINFNNDGSLTFPNTGLADVSITNSATVNVMNDAGASGEIEIQANSLSITNNSSLDAGNFGNGDAGNIFLQVRHSFFLEDSSIFSDVVEGIETSGDITIEAGKIEITNSQIRSDAVSDNTDTGGVTGSIFIESVNNIAINNSSITSDSNDTGNSFGIIEIFSNSGSVNLNEVTLSTENIGNGIAGDIVLDADKEIILSPQTQITSDGQQGQILIGQNITPTRVSIKDTDLTTTNFSNGQAGNIAISATEEVVITDSNLSSDAVSDNENSNSVGSAGIISIDGNQLVTITNSQINSESNSLAQEGFGEVRILAETGYVNLKQTNISTDNSSDGIAGDITIDADKEIIISDQTQITSDGQQGQIVIGPTITPTRVILDDANLTTTNFGTGFAGNINISATEEIIITNNSTIFSDAFNNTDTGESVAGSITIDAPQSVSIINSSITSESNSSSENFGDISIFANQGSIDIDNSAISATNFDVGFAGDILINAQNQVLISNSSSITSDGEIGQIFVGNELVPRNVTINNSRLTTTNEAGDQDFTLPLEIDIDAGNLEIKAIESIVINDSELFAVTARTGDAGTIILETVNSNGQIFISNSDIASTVESAAIGNAGNITITSDFLVVTDSSEISTETLGDGNAGSINIQAASVSIQEGSNVSSEASSNVNGNAGTVTINADEFSIASSSQANVSSGAGLAGNLIINSRNITSDEGRLIAFTAGGGANIELTVSNLMLLRNESLISATASEQADGGNVTINARFIIVEPPIGEKGSDISANAFAGNGGLVNITTDGLFGIEFMPAPTIFNDITVTSELGDAGIVEIMQPDTNPAEGLTNFPTDLVDASRLIIRSCPTDDSEEALGRFVVTGRGGLPANPGEILRSTNILVDLVELESQTQEIGNREIWKHEDTETIVEAQGWVVNREGKILLTAQIQANNFSSPASYCLNK